LLKKIEPLKTPTTNIAIIQQNILLKYKEFYWFLLERHPEASEEIRQTYVTIVGNYFTVAFDKYVKAILKLQVRVNAFVI